MTISSLYTVLVGSTSWFVHTVKQYVHPTTTTNETQEYNHLPVDDVDDSLVDSMISIFNGDELLNDVSIQLLRRSYSDYDREVYHRDIQNYSNNTSSFDTRQLLRRRVYKILRQSSI